MSLRAELFAEAAATSLLRGFSRRLWNWKPRRSWLECRISSCLMA